MQVPRMENAKNRVSTFKDYRMSNLVNDLVIWGLFCKENTKVLQCFFCGHIFADWKITDSAKSRHLQESPHCEHFKEMVRSQRYPFSTDATAALNVDTMLFDQLQHRLDLGITSTAQLSNEGIAEDSNPLDSSCLGAEGGASISTTLTKTRRDYSNDRKRIERQAKREQEDKQHDKLFNEVDKEFDEIGQNLYCMKCNTNLSDVVLLPCRHMKICEDCFNGNREEFKCCKCEDMASGHLIVQHD